MVAGQWNKFVAAGGPLSDTADRLTSVNGVPYTWDKQVRRTRMPSRRPSPPRWRSP